MSNVVRIRAAFGFCLAVLSTLLLFCGPGAAQSDTAQHLITDIRSFLGDCYPVEGAPARSPEFCTGVKAGLDQRQAKLHLSNEQIVQAFQCKGPYAGTCTRNPINYHLYEP
jgi:hypothetical protein